MTTIFFDKLKCAVCGKENEFQIMGSSNSFGSTDLDSRPAPMIRYTMEMWVHRCAECGYCAKNITEKLPGTEKIIRTENYINQLNNPNMPELGNIFLCYSMLLNNANEYADAGWSALQAAWICDDNGENEGARACRIKAIELFAKANKNNQIFAEKPEMQMIIITDLLRRADEFKHADDMCKKGLETAEDEICINIFNFEKKLIADKDSGCYKVEDSENFNKNRKKTN